MEQHVQVSGDHSTLLEIVLGSLFSSFEKLRRQPDQTVAADDWTWVLRSSASTRAVLRWQDGGIVLDAPQAESESAQRQGAHGILDLTSGADRPGSIANLGDSPATAFAYDVGMGSKGRLLMAGQFSYDEASSAAGLAMEWLPSGEPGVGPQMSFVVRESRLGPDGLTFRGLRVSRDDQLAIGDRVSVRYGAEYLAAGFNGTTSALRPRGEVEVKLAKDWKASALVASHPWQDNPDSQGALQTALDALDGFPTLLVRDGHPYLENGLHEEASLEHEFTKNFEPDGGGVPRPLHAYGRDRPGRRDESRLSPGLFRGCFCVRCGPIKLHGSSPRVPTENLGACDHDVRVFLRRRSWAARRFIRCRPP